MLCLIFVLLTMFSVTFFLPCIHTSIPPAVVSLPSLPFPLPPFHLKESTDDLVRRNKSSLPREDRKEQVHVHQPPVVISCMPKSRCALLRLHNAQKTPTTTRGGREGKGQVVRQAGRLNEQPTVVCKFNRQEISRSVLGIVQYIFRNL